MTTHRKTSTHRTALRTTLHAEYLTYVGPTYPPVAIRLRWQSSAPDVVAADFGADQPRWVLSRELLDAGCDGPAGLGDVFLLPDPVHAGALELVLDTPTGTAAFRLPAPRLRTFLARIADAVPPGGGHWQITDHELRAHLDHWRRTA